MFFSIGSINACEPRFTVHTSIFDIKGTPSHKDYPTRLLTLASDSARHGSPFSPNCLCEAILPTLYNNLFMDVFFEHFSFFGAPSPSLKKRKKNHPQDLFLIES